MSVRESNTANVLLKSPKALWWENQTLPLRHKIGLVPHWPFTSFTWKPRNQEDPFDWGTQWDTVQKGQNIQFGIWEKFEKRTVEICYNICNTYYTHKRYQIWQKECNSLWTQKEAGNLSQQILGKKVPQSALVDLFLQSQWIQLFIPVISHCVGTHTAMTFWLSLVIDGALFLPFGCLRGSTTRSDAWARENACLLLKSSTQRRQQNQRQKFKKMYKATPHTPIPSLRLDAESALVAARWLALAWLVILPMQSKINPNVKWPAVA